MSQERLTIKAFDILVNSVAVLDIDLIPNTFIKICRDTCIKSSYSHFILVVKWTFMTLNAAYIQLVMKKRRRLTGSMINLGTSIHIIYDIHETGAPMEQSWNRQ